MNFKEYYKSPKVIETPHESDEDLFLSAFGEKVSSVEAFLSWLILNDIISSNYVNKVTKRPISIFTLPINKKILFLSEKLPDIKKRIKEFNQKWR